MPGKHNGVAAANGGGSDHRSFMNNFDPDDPEYIRDLQRPAAIKVYISLPNLITILYG